VERGIWAWQKEGDAEAVVESCWFDLGWSVMMLENISPTAGKTRISFMLNVIKSVNALMEEG